MSPKVQASTSFAAVLQRLRHAAGLSQEELAERAGVSARAVSDLERGVRQGPRPATLRMLVGALSLTEPDRAALMAAANVEQAEQVANAGGNPAVALPWPPTPLVGRQAEIHEVTTLLHQRGVRLVTLTGVGGVGKTRLALEIAHQLSATFADGAVFVDLSPIRDPALVLPAIAWALGIQEEPGMSLLAPLQRLLHSRRLLLLLDNLEQVVAAAPVAAELLASCPGLSVLATSRVRLRLRGEREYPLGPLALPELTRGTAAELTPERMVASPAVHLFVERARAAKTNFAVTDDIASDIGAICQRLDGLPLAIELAAARVRVLPPQVMLTRLEQRLPLLTGGARDAPERQRTMRDTIAWSYDLLDPDEQTLFRRLAVFVGGCTLELAEVVGNDDGALDALSGVERLCEHSLLRHDEGSGGEPRFSMLETIREFGLELLAASGEDSAARDAHAAAMVALAESAMHPLEGPDQGLWVDRLNADHANVREAVGWLSGRGRVADILRIAAGLKWFWCLFHAAESGQWLEEALAEAEDIPWRLRADALYAAGHLRRFQGDSRGGLALHEEELALRNEAGDDAGLGRVLLVLGLEKMELGDPSAADSFVLEALDRLRAAGDRWGIGLALTSLAELAEAGGDLEAAANRYEEALRMQRSIGDAYHVVLMLTRLSKVVIRLGDSERAQEHALAALATAEEAGLDHTRIPALIALAEVAMARTDLAAAEDYARQALETAQATGDEENEASCALYLAHLDHLRSNRVAANYLRHALKLCRCKKYPQVAARIFETIGVIATNGGKAKSAALLFGAAVNADPGIALQRLLSEESGYEWAIAAARANLGESVYVAAYDVGRGLSLDAALTEAVVLVDELTARSAAERLPHQA